MFTFEEIKTLLLKSIDEYDCEDFEILGFWK